MSNPDLFYKEIFNRLPFTKRDEWNWKNVPFTFKHLKGSEQYSVYSRKHYYILNERLSRFGRIEGIEIDYSKFNSRDEHN